MGSQFKLNNIHTSNQELFDKIRKEKERFYSLNENSSIYLNLIKEYMRDHGDFNLSLYRDNYLQGRIFIRIRAKKIESFREYHEYLKQNPGELEHLKSMLTIHTTEFFRDTRPFLYLEEILLPKISRYISNPKQTIRILSAPCSTGQEVYSLAIIVHFLKMKHNLPNPVEIHGIDVDEKSIVTATKGLYRTNFQKNINFKSMTTNFNVVNSNFIQVKNDIKQYCKFYIHDMFKPLTFSQKFDLILCRNFLIYISKSDQMQIIENLKLNAKKGAYFMLGITEGLGLMYHDDFGIESLDDHIFQYTKVPARNSRPTSSKTKNTSFRSQSKQTPKQYPNPNQIEKLLESTGIKSSVTFDNSKQNISSEPSLDLKKIIEMEKGTSNDANYNKESKSSEIKKIPPKHIKKSYEGLVDPDAEQILINTSDSFDPNQISKLISKVEQKKKEGIKLENIKVLRNQEFIIDGTIDSDENPNHKFAYKNYQKSLQITSSLQEEEESDIQELVQRAKINKRVQDIYNAASISDPLKTSKNQKPITLKSSHESGKRDNTIDIKTRIQNIMDQKDLLKKEEELYAKWDKNIENELDGVETVNIVEDSDEIYDSEPDVGQSIKILKKIKKNQDEEIAEIIQKARSS